MPSEPNINVWSRLAEQDNDLCIPLSYITPLSQPTSQRKSCFTNNTRWAVSSEDIRSTLAILYIYYAHVADANDRRALKWKVPPLEFNQLRSHKPASLNTWTNWPIQPKSKSKSGSTPISTHKHDRYAPRSSYPLRVHSSQSQPIKPPSGCYLISGRTPPSTIAHAEPTGQ